MITTTTTEEQETTTIPETTTTVQKECNGCMHDGVCLSIGTRVEVNGTPLYCSLRKILEVQKEKGRSCMNNYECKSNFCSDGECYDIRGEMQETKGILQTIIEFLRSIFGFI